MAGEGRGTAPKMNLYEDRKERQTVLVHRAPSPEPSCVSLKSNNSMFASNNFSSADNSDPSVKRASPMPTSLTSQSFVKPAEELTITAVQTTIFLVVFFLGVIGNGLVIATFALYRRLRLRCMTDVFLFYLALSDMLLLLTLPLQTGETLIGSWVFGEALCKLNRGMYAINTYSGLLL